MRRYAPLTALVLMLCGCLATTRGTSYADPPVSAPSLRSAADYLKDRNGHAMLVYHRDKLVFEEYFNGWSAEKPHRLASGTKSFCCAIVAAAVEDGLLKLDEKVADTIVEWKDDANSSQITIRQLLSLTSGIEGGSTWETAPSYARAVAIANPRARPGQRFQYGPIPFQVFGELMRRKLAQKSEPVGGYLKRRILDPIGLTPSHWVRDEGDIRLPNGASMTAREWAKFGLFIQHRGRWQDRQIVPAKVLEECFVGTPANGSYGLAFWLARRVGWGPADLVMAHGRGNQILYIVPSLELIVVQFAETAGFQESDYLERLLVRVK
jgi:CubicO group peptidase (beta-lactamase class C family)